MMDRELVFLLEEPSAAELLKQILPRLLPARVTYRCIPFEGKSDLEKQLPKKLRNWRNSNARFVVLRDQDSADCIQVKQKITNICHAAGKPDALVRIVCRELESWYLGDLQAVETGLDIHGLARLQQKAQYRNPDRIHNAKQQLQKLTRKHYQPVSGSRKIGAHLSLHNNRSHSFNVFVSGVKQLTV